MDWSWLGSCPLLAAGSAALVAAYGALLLWFRAGVGRARPAVPRDAAERPHLVSVVVAARNEEARIDACLGALIGQDYPGDGYEIIVVDDGSRDGTAARVEEAASGSAVPLRLLRAEGDRGKKAAMALGVGRARGEFILCTDADCLPPPVWVRRLVDYFDAADVGMVIGFSQIGPPGSRHSALSGWEAEDFLLLMAASLGSASAGHPMAASGQSLAFRRRAWEEVGGYDSVMHRASGDDSLLLQLIRRTGRWRVRFAADPAAGVVHPPSDGLKALVRQRARWSSNGPYLARLDPMLFLYLCLTLGTNALLALTPVLWWAGWLSAPVVAGLWAAKAGADAALHVAATRAFARADLHRYFPLWAAAEPAHVLAAGVLGAVGRFPWKGRSYQGGTAPAGTGTTR